MKPQRDDGGAHVTDYEYYNPLVAPTSTEANAGRLHTITLPDPDGAGPLARPVITHTWDLTGNLLTQSDALNRVTSWVRDDLDPVIETHLPDPDGIGVGVPAPVYETEYDALGNVLISPDALGNETAFAWDIMSRMTSQTGEDPDGAGPLTSPVTTLVWTDAGELESSTDPAGRTTSWERDLLGRVLTTVLPDIDGVGGDPPPELHTSS